MKSFLSKISMLIVLVSFVVGTGLIVFAEEYNSQIYKCHHPKEPESCPSGQPTQSLHCQACTTACGSSHEAGVKCVMDYPCGKEYKETAYCSPEPQY